MEVDQIPVLLFTKFCNFVLPAWLAVLTADSAAFKSSFCTRARSDGEELGRLRVVKKKGSQKKYNFDWRIPAAGGGGTRPFLFWRPPLREE